MLKPKNLIILVIVLAVLAVISFVQKAKHRSTTSQGHTNLLIAGPLDKDQLERIEIRHPGKDAVVTLVNQPEGWAVATAWHAKANEQRIEALLRGLDNLYGEFRSDNADVLEDYGLVDTLMVTVTGHAAGGGDALFTLQLGNQAGRGIGNFVKLPGNNAVYVSANNVLGDLGMYSGPDAPTSKHFLVLNAHKVDRQDVDTITLRDGASTITLVKEFAEPEPAADDTTGALPEIDRSVYEWRITEPQPQAAPKTKADGVLGAVSSIRASDVTDPGVDLATYGLIDPAKEARITLQDGTVVGFAFGDERQAEEGNPAGVYLRIDESPTIWVVNTYNLNNVFKSLEDLLPDE